jgi:hypothetical protein
MVQRIFQRLRDVHGGTGGITIVTDRVRDTTRRTREAFGPRSIRPGMRR